MFILLEQSGEIKLAGGKINVGLEISTFHFFFYLKYQTAPVCKLVPRFEGRLHVASKMITFCVRNQKCLIFSVQCIKSRGES